MPEHINNQPFIKNYSWSLEHKVWLRDDYSYKIEYSDGAEIENKIYELVKNSLDLTVLSDELESHIFDWTSRCSLSKKRANLLRPFSKYFEGKKILEVGCGAGPITRFLGECGADVYAIEPSLQRARIAAERCRDLSNVKVFCDDIENLSLDVAFDGIVQVGVLEYATKYSTDPAAPLLYLKRLKQYLKVDGFLITAIENQLGLKYLSGFAEDHIGKFMHGVNNNYVAGEATTFGRKSLVGLFQNAGFPINEVFLPFPDYKLPTLVIYPDYYDKAEHSKFDIESILSNLSYQDIQKKTSLFSLDRALPLIAKNNLLYELGNSFCVFSKLNDTDSYEKTNMLALYNTDRKKVYTKETIFRQLNGKVVVQRRSLFDNPLNKNDKAVTFPAIESAFEGNLYHNQLVQIVNRDNWTVNQVADWLAGWYYFLKKELIVYGGARPEDILNVRALVNAKYIDAIPINMIGNEHKWRFIDLEINLDQKVEIGYLIFRAIYVSVSRLSSVAPPEIKEHQEIDKLMFALYSSLGFNLTEDLLDEYYRLEAKLVSSIAPLEIASLKGSIIKMNVREPLDGKQDLQHQMSHLQQSNHELTTQIENLRAEVSELHMNIEQANAQISGLVKQDQENADHISKLNSELTLKNEAVVQLQQRVVDSEKLLETNEARIASLNRQVETLLKNDKELVEKRAHIHKLNQEIQSYRANKEALEQMISEKVKHVDQLETQVKGMYHEIYSLSTSRKRLIANLLKRTFLFNRNK